MPTKFISDNPWLHLTAAVRSCKRPCYVAVAYFGQGAAQMLPLPTGSRLVVDASERTVKLGLTCPAELLKLQKRGVEVFSVMNLHAKVYVADRNAFIGSANASRHSAGTLIETLFHTTEPQAVKQVRQFVEGLCLQRLGPEQLKALVKIYRPPHLPGGKRSQQTRKTKALTPEVAELRLAQVSTSAERPEEEEPWRQDGEATASKERQHRNSTHRLDDFRWWGACGFRKGQQIIRVEEDRGHHWVCPPGYVRHVRKIPRQATWYVYVEFPNLRRKSIDRLAATLGRGAKKKLLVSGPVRDRSFAQALLKAWSA